MTQSPPALKLLPIEKYRGVNRNDPIRYYKLPIIGALYRRRVELCLAQCTGGERVLEVGFGSGVSFLNLATMYRHIYGLDLTADIDAVGSVFTPLGIQAQLHNGSVLEMPYQDNFFDTVLLISILEHLQPDQQKTAFAEIYRVLRPGGQVVYGVPVERPLMVFLFRLLGHNIRLEHFSTEQDISAAARQWFGEGRLEDMKGFPGFVGAVYQVGNFIKT